MKTHADKTQVDISQLVANKRSQKQSHGESSFQFVDNRPEAIVQRKLQGMLNNSPQAKRAAQLQAMADSRSKVNQLRSSASYVTQLNSDEDKRPFVELAQGVKEKVTRVKTGLLGSALKDNENVRAGKSENNRPASRKAHYLYHSTTYRNLITILSKGLDPNRGGSEIGASALAEGKLKDDSLKGSQGYVHGATQSEVALHYANKFDSKERQKATCEGAGFSVVLRFVVGDSAAWTEDTEDKRGNYKTRNIIQPSDIEFLEVESGWKPLASIDQNVLKALETEKALVPVSPVRDITPKSSLRTGVTEEKNLSHASMSPDIKS